MIRREIARFLAGSGPSSPARPNPPQRFRSGHEGLDLMIWGGRAEVLPQDLDHGDINAHLGLDSDYTRAVEAFMGSLDAEVVQRLR